MTFRPAVRVIIMGTVYNRGTQANPNWWVAYKDGDGRRRHAPSRQPTKTRRGYTGEGTMAGCNCGPSGRRCPARKGSLRASPPGTRLHAIASKNTYSSGRGSRGAKYRMVLLVSSGK